MSESQIDRELELVGLIRLDDEDEQLIGIRDAFVALMRLLHQQVADAEDRTTRSEVIRPIIVSNGRCYFIAGLYNIWPI